MMAAAGPGRNQVGAKMPLDVDLSILAVGMVDGGD